MVKLTRWSDGHSSNGGATMSKREIRPRGKRGVLYASCRWKGVLLQDSLETTDEQLARIRLADLKNQIDRGEYQSWKLSWDQIEADYLREDGRYVHILGKVRRDRFRGANAMQIEITDVAEPV